MNEVRRTADSRQSESEAKPLRSKKYCRKWGAWGGWRLDVWKCKISNRSVIKDTCPGALKEQGRSQSPHSSDEASNDRGAKGGRKVET
jgi:hypothetical protein